MSLSLTEFVHQVIVPKISNCLLKSHNMFQFLVIFVMIIIILIIIFISSIIIIICTFSVIVFDVWKKKTKLPQGKGAEKKIEKKTNKC